MKDPYWVLGIPEDADDALIQRAHRELLRRYPPETAGERFQEIAEAYEVLRDPEKRAEHRLFGCLAEEGIATVELDEFLPRKEATRARAGMAAWHTALGEIDRG